MNEQEPTRRFSGVWIPAKVWLNKEINCVERCLLGEIQALGGETGECYASNEYLGESVGVSESRAASMISHLRQLQLVETSKFDGRRRYLRILYDSKPVLLKTARLPKRKREVRPSENDNKGTVGENTREKEEENPPAEADGPTIKESSEYSQCIEALKTAFFETHGYDSDMKKADYVAIDHVFKLSKDWHELVELAKWAWTHIDPKDHFMFDQLHTFRRLFAQVNELRARKSTNGTGTQYRVNGVEMGCRNKGGQEERNKQKLRDMGIKEIYDDPEEAKRDNRIVGSVRMEWFGMLRDMREE